MRSTKRLAVVGTAIAAIVPAGVVLSASPALAWSCYVVTANDMRTFSASTGSTMASPFTIYRGQRVRVFERLNGRYRVNFEWAQNPSAGTYFGRWISADSSFTNPFSGACTHG